jgi:hypothetical protein
MFGVICMAPRCGLKGEQYGGELISLRTLRALRENCRISNVDSRFKLPASNTASEYTRISF